MMQQTRMLVDCILQGKSSLNLGQCDILIIIIVALGGGGGKLIRQC